VEDVNVRAGLNHLARELVAHNEARSRRLMAPKDVQLTIPSQHSRIHRRFGSFHLPPTERCISDFQDHISWVLDLRSRSLFESDFHGAFENHGLHFAVDVREFFSVNLFARL
jgi:hypothetical protein